MLTSKFTYVVVYLPSIDAHLFGRCDMSTDNIDKQHNTSNQENVLSMLLLLSCPAEHILHVGVCFVRCVRARNRPQTCLPDIYCSERKSDDDKMKRESRLSRDEERFPTIEGTRTEERVVKLRLPCWTRCRTGQCVCLFRLIDALPLDFTSVAQAKTSFVIENSSVGDG